MAGYGYERGVGHFFLVVVVVVVDWEGEGVRGGC